ncbi:MAG: hypothetical protein Kow0037_20780 [Calditrichia bacterium]
MIVQDNKKISEVLSWMNIGQFIYRTRKVNIVFSILIFILSVVFVFFIMEKQYTASTSLLPPNNSNIPKFSGALGNIASIAGIDFGSLSFQNPMMYKGILESTFLLKQVIFNKYEINGEKKNLIEFLEVEGKNEDEKFQKILKRLTKSTLVIDIDDDNMILTLSVTLPNPELSAKVANYMVSLLQKIVKDKLQKEYIDQREYVETRMAQISDSLKITENQLKTFLEKNTDPTLPDFQIEKMRLTRKMEIHSAVFIQLKKQLEIMHIQNFMNLSPVKVLDVAFPPYRKSRPKRLFVLIVILLLLYILQLFVNIGIIYYRHFKQDILPSLKRG